MQGRICIHTYIYTNIVLVLYRLSPCARHGVDPLQRPPCQISSSVRRKHADKGTRQTMKHKVQQREASSATTGLLLLLLSALLSKNRYFILIDHFGAKRL